MIMSDEVAKAFETIKQAMIDDNPSGRNYAYSWHCNIAMMCHDAIEDGRLSETESKSMCAHTVANDAASRFMKLCFDVETKA
jgi:hypothetical protein